jgi:hypothetical protein
LIKSSALTSNLKKYFAPLSTFLLVVYVLFGQSTWAQALQISPTIATSAARLTAKTSLTLANPLANQDWQSLTPAQKIALKPLSTSWANLNERQKRKWISLGANFSRMTIADQDKLHERMAQWAALTPKQREHARLNFAETQQISPQQKTEQWQAYQALSSDAKQKLAKAAPPKPPLTRLAPKPLSQVTKKNPLPLAPNKPPLLSQPAPFIVPTPPNQPRVTNESRQP